MALFFFFRFYFVNRDDVFALGVIQCEKRAGINLKLFHKCARVVGDENGLE